MSKKATETEIKRLVEELLDRVDPTKPKGVTLTDIRIFSNDDEAGVKAALNESSELVLFQLIVALCAKVNSLETELAFLNTDGIRTKQ